MKLYCANCGVGLTLIRKALPKLGIIVNLVQYHECPQVIDPDTKFDLDGKPASIVEGMDKCVLSLNQLEPSHNQGVREFHERDFGKIIEAAPKRGFGGVGTDDLRDRRFDQDRSAKSTAPNSIAEQIKIMSNSIPAHEVDEIEKGGPKENDSSEMGD